MRYLIFILGLVLLSGCAQHRLIVAQPNPGVESEKYNSTALLLPKGQKRHEAVCDTNVIDEVRVHQNLGQSLISLLTLGFVQPTTIEYFCANVPSDEGSTDE